MIWILPLAGKGKRTNSLGSFKPFIRINKKKIIEWFFLGLKTKFKKNDLIIFITTKEFEVKNNFKKNIKKILKKNGFNIRLKFKFLDHTPNGPAYTVNSIKNDLDNKNSCIVINCDQFIDFDLPLNLNKKKIYIPLHYNFHGNSSYVLFQKNGGISSIKEKKMISNYASSGVYIFGNTQLLKLTLEFLNEGKFKKEVNMSNLLNLYIKKYNIALEPLETYTKYDLGNLSSIKKFNYKKIEIK